MLKKYLILSAAVLTLGLAGCSDDSKKAAHNIRAEPDLQGSFTDACSSSKLAELSEKIRLNFEGNKYTRSQIFYNESDCVNEVGRIEYTGEFVAGEQNENNPTRGGTMDLDVQTVKVKSSNDTLTKALNALNYCGHNDFATGTEVSISGKQTQGLCPLTNVPVKLYTAYRLENNRLYFGDSDISTMSGDANSRTQSIVYDKAYLKDK